MPGNYYWIGGYTGNQGQGSGYSGNYNGSGTAVWTNPFTGVTGTRGDYHFSPYCWWFKENWLEQIGATATGEPILTTASRAPRNGDTVYLDPMATSGHMPHSIALLFGGLSGASGFWSGTTSTSQLYEFVVRPSYGGMPQDSSPYTQTLTGLSGAHRFGSYVTAPGATAYRGLRTKMIGFEWNQGAAPDPDGFPQGVEFLGASSRIDPLDIKASSFEFSPSRADAYINFFNSSPYSAYMYMGPYGTGPNDPAKQTMYAIGKLTTIEQNSGLLYTLSLSGQSLEVDNISARGYMGMNLHQDTTVNTLIDCKPSATWRIGTQYEGIAIKCAVPTLITESGLTLGNEPSLSSPGATGVLYFIGDRTGTATPTIGSWKIDNGPLNRNPYINMFSFVCDDLDAKNCYMKPNFIDAQQPTAKQIYPIFRDGKLGQNATLDCYANHTVNWNNVFIGYSPSDQGLRIDDDSARIIFHLGDNVKINGKEWPIGVTS